jgi:hypothetical protein
LLNEILAFWRELITSVRARSVELLAGYYDEDSLQTDCKMAGIDCASLPGGNFNERLRVFFSILDNVHLIPIIVRRIPYDSIGRQEIEKKLVDDSKSIFLNLIYSYWSIEGLKDLCLKLDVKYDDLPSSIFRKKAQELVEHLGRRARLLYLMAEMIVERPDLADPQQAT